MSPFVCSNHQLRDYLLNRLFRLRSKKTSKLRVTGLCAGSSPGTGEFPAQMVSNAENVSFWWRHHGCYTNRGSSNIISNKNFKPIYAVQLQLIIQTMFTCIMPVGAWKKIGLSSWLVVLFDISYKYDILNISPVITQGIPLINLNDDPWNSFAFSNSAYSWNSLSWKTRTCLSYRVNIMADAELVSHKPVN